MHKDTITLFNRIKGGRGHGDTWSPTILKGVNLNLDRASILAKYGEKSQDKAWLSIPYKRIEGLKTVGEKTYVTPMMFTDPDSEITFASGNQFDFFWVGEWDGGTVSDDDFKSNVGFYNYMNDTYDNVFMVSSMSVLFVIPHFEILGK
jgi:hypothetical protein